MLNKIKKHYLILLASHLSESRPFLCHAFKKLWFGKFFLQKEFEMLKLLVGKERFPNHPLYMFQFCDPEPFDEKFEIYGIETIMLRLRLEIVKSWIDLLGSNLPLGTQVEITRRQVRTEMNEAFK